MTSSTTPHRKKGTPRPPPAPLKTSDYSSDEEFTASKTVSQEAYEVYKKSGDWWNVFPKTDYTYSRISPHRKTLPGVPGMVFIPNMSRRSLHGELNMSSVSDTSRLTSTKIRNEMMNSPSSLSYSQYSENYNSSYQPQSTSYQTAATSQSPQNGMFSKMKEYYSKMSSYTREEDFDYDSDFDEVDMAATKTASSFSQSESQSLWWSVWLLITTTITTVTTTVTNSASSAVSSVAGNTASILSFHWMGRLLEWLYWLVANVLLFDTWLLRSANHVRSPSTSTDSWKRLRHLAILLTPILLLLCWWACSSNSDHSLSASSLLSVAKTFSPIPLLSNITSVTGRAISALAQFGYHLGSGLLSLFWWLIPFGSRESSSSPATFVSRQSDNSFTAGSGVVPPCQMNVELLAKQILESGPFQEFAVRVTAFEKQQEYVARETVKNVQSSSDASDTINVIQFEQLKQEFKSEVSSKADDQYRLMMAKLGQTAQGQREQSAILSRLASELRNLREQTNVLSAAIVEQQAGGQNTSETISVLNGMVAGLQGQIKELQEQQRILAASLKDCCKNSGAAMRATVEEHVTAFLSQALGPPPPSGKASGKRVGGAGYDKATNLTAWIRSYFVAHDILEARLASLAQDIKRETNDGMVMTMQQSTETIMGAVSKRIQNEFVQHSSGRLSTTTSSRDGSASVSANLGLSDYEVRKIVQEVLTVYDADKTGRVDYALESSGGSIVSTRCTETFHAQSAVVSLFGIPLWYPSNNPRTVIQPGVQPGECWAFKGSQGYVVIQLSGFVRISAFSLEHIPRSLSPTGSIDSAPRDFKVLGLKQENDKEPVELGEYTYNQNSSALQYFIVQDPNPQPFRLVELQILSNHGHMEYTCLYRFRVHGVLMK